MGWALIRPLFRSQQQGDIYVCSGLGDDWSGKRGPGSWTLSCPSAIRGSFGSGKVLVLGPVFEAVALTIFAAEHFLAARGLSAIVPRWIPGALFWTCFFGAALLAAAISFITWRYVRWSASLLALFFLIIVTTIDLPNLPKHAHERLFWTLTVRETAFAGGAMVLAGSQWPRGRPAPQLWRS